RWRARLRVVPHRRERAVHAERNQQSSRERQEFLGPRTAYCLYTFRGAVRTITRLLSMAATSKPAVAVTRQLWSSMQAGISSTCTASGWAIPTATSFRHLPG